MFDPNIFLQFPTFMVITEAASKLLDVASIKHALEPKELLLVLWMGHRDSTADQINACAEQLKLAGSGVFITEMADNLCVVDSVLPPAMRRIYMVCTHAQAAEAHANIEDFANHMHGKIIRGAGE